MLLKLHTKCVRSQHHAILICDAQHRRARDIRRAAQQHSARSAQPAYVVQNARATLSAQQAAEHIKRPRQTGAREERTLCAGAAPRQQLPQDQP